MQMKHILNGRALAKFGPAIKTKILSKTTVGLAFCALFLLAFVTPAAAQSETVLISASPSRITVPFNYSGTNATLVNLSIANGTNEVDFNLSGLPAGATASLSKTVFTNGSGTSTITFGLTNVAEGIYWLTLSATNSATNFLNFPCKWETCGAAPAQTRTGQRQATGAAGWCRASMMTSSSAR